MEIDSNNNQIALTGLEDLEDLKVMFKWINDKKFVNYNSSYSPIHYLNHEEWFDTIRKNKSLVLFAIRLKISNQLIGSCQLHSINSIHRTAELQIRIDLKYTGSGHGNKALRLLLQHGFQDLNLNKIYLYVFEDNNRAFKLYQKIGFQQEGLLKKHVYVNGEYKNVLLMSIFNEDFETNK